MDEVLVSLLDTVGLGTGLVILGGIVTTGFGVYKFIKAMLDKYNAHIKKKLAKEEDDKNFRCKMTKLGDDFVSLKDDLEHRDNETKEYRDKYSKQLSDFSSKMDQYDSYIKDQKKAIDDISDNINDLNESNQAAIKSYIVNEFHKWTIAKYIDVYAYETIENRYEKYLKSHGDTYVSSLMNDLRKLPKRYNSDDNEDESQDNK